MRSANVRRPSITCVIPIRTIDAASWSSIRWPSKVTVPLVTSPSWMPSKPEIARSVVVLPAPFAPSNATILPSGTTIDSPRSTRITSL